MQEPLNVFRLEVILSDMGRDLVGLPLHAHLKNCQKLIEEGWLPEFDDIASLQRLKPYFNDPLHTLVVKLFLLKTLYTFFKDSSSVLDEDIQWLISMKRKLHEQFKTLCDRPNQHIVYHGNHVHTVEELEALAKTETSPFISTPTLTNIFIAILAVTLLNQQTNEYKPYAVSAGISAALILATLFMVYQAVLPALSPARQPVPTPSPEVLITNAFVNNSLLISLAEFNKLRNSSLLEKAKYTKAQVQDLSDHLADTTFLNDCKYLAQQGWNARFNATPALQIFKPTDDLINHYLLRTALVALIAEKQFDQEWIGVTKESLNRERTALLCALTPTTHPRYINHARIEATSAFTVFNIYRYLIHDNLRSRSAQLTGLSIAGLCLLYAGLVFFNQLTPTSLTAKTFFWGSSDQLSFRQRRQFKALLESPEFRDLFDVPVERLEQVHKQQPKK